MQAAQLGELVGVVVDAQVEVALPRLVARLADDEQRGRLAPADVAALPMQSAPVCAAALPCASTSPTPNQCDWTAPSWPLSGSRATIE